MKDTFYFSHDYNARQDDKIKRLIMKYGMLWYWVYWSIVENLYNNANALHLDYECIAYELRTDEKTIKSIIKDFGLFVEMWDIFKSLSIERRLNQRDEKSKKARDSAKQRWSKKDDDANALQTDSDSNAIKERKGKESKINNNINFDDIKNIPIENRTVTQHFITCAYDLWYSPAKDETEETLREWISWIAKMKMKSPNEMIDIITQWHTYWKWEKKPVKNHKSSLLNQYQLKWSKYEKQHR